MTLADLKAGQRARITAVDAIAPGVVPLMTLGLVEGTLVAYRQSAIGGDPIELDVMGAAISVRLAQAASITVELDA